ncbi:hypothetical protein GWO43_14235 [candidate division KSB1 bacterium]|nr:hypothetical protein [candidate division KSB1 bacterium]NIR72444.1 hypothetical protein [candidate division KSB1 bacterium]NIS25083.1 hypothetical protein [candidate division KSB1 bacterium]NIT72002.1 hypothetical protein [candidate division KSB1 bacterium]NIU25782.1 hypothetical protein [candidate division KSB1 bacterium]
MKKYHSILTILILSLFMMWSACDDFVQDVEPIFDEVPDDALNDEEQIPFLSDGVKQRFATTHDNVVILSEGLGDAFFFDSNVPNATFPTFRDIDEGDITLDNNSVDGMFLDLGELRFFADDLLRRINEIEISDSEVEREARFTGNLFGGIARYFFATYMGLNPEEGGGVIDNGPFIPSSEMYDLALEKLQQALTHVGSDYETRVINSLIARIHLYAGNTGSVRQFAEQGLVEGDDPFQSLHSTESTNLVWQQGGRGRTQYVVSQRFIDFVIADSAETVRIPLEPITGNDGVTVFQRQIKYPSERTPIDLISWQENELMLAELELDSDNASALARVNRVRASHELAPLDALDRQTFIDERAKELFLTGAELPDQRRFGTFHLPAGRWQFLPITERERNINPNF